MSATLPTKLLKLKILAEVPRSIYMEGPAAEDVKDEKKRLDFLKMLRRGPSEPAQVPPRKTKALHQLNAAVWMRFTDVPPQPVALVLVYRDQKGEFAVMVDEAQVGPSRSVMLSGNVTIEARGPIEYVRACCAGVEDGQRYVVDELYVQKVVDAQKAGAEPASGSQKRTA